MKLPLKLIYGWLIFCVGALAPLTFSTPLSPHRDVSVVNFVFFESPRHFSLPSASPKPAVTSLQWMQRMQQFNPQDRFHSFESFTPSLVQFFQSNISSGYILSIGRAYLILQTSLLGFVALYILTGRSALLSPLEKPPQTFFA